MKGNRPKRRPRRYRADYAIMEHIATLFGCPRELVPTEVHLAHDGSSAWSFFLLPGDTTSYVQADLTIEWYGTAWTPPPFCYACKGLARDVDLRPYGPNGALVCFPCATRTPETNAAAQAELGRQMDAATRRGPGVLGEPTGPRPLEPADGDA